MKETNLQQRLALRSHKEERRLSDESKRTVVSLLTALLAEYAVAINDQQKQEEKQ